MPEKACGDGTPGFPGFAERFQIFGGRTLAKAFHFLHGGGESQITAGPDVRPAKRAQEINVSGPGADALEGDEHFAGGIVLQRVEITKIEIAASERFGKEASVESFLTAEADAKQFDITEFQEASWSKGIYRGFEASESGARRSERNLLLENNVNERGKTGFAHPQRRLAVSFHDGSQVSVAVCQEAHTLRECRFVKDPQRRVSR